MTDVTPPPILPREGSFIRLPNCPQCDYALQGLPPAGRCPECGFEYDEQTFVLKGMSRGLSNFSPLRAILTAVPKRSSSSVR